MRYIRQSYGPCSLIKFHKKKTCEEFQIGELPDLNLVPRWILATIHKSLEQRAVAFYNKYRLYEGN